MYSRINFVCFAFEQYESVKIQLALSKAACFPISVSSYLTFELTLLQNGLLKKRIIRLGDWKGKRVQIIPLQDAPRFSNNFWQKYWLSRRKKRKMVRPVAKKNYGHIQHRNFSSFQYDGMWPVNMTGKANIWPVKTPIRLDIVRWPAVISSLVPAFFFLKFVSLRQVQYRTKESY